MKKLNLSNLKKLSKTEMRAIKGGTTRAQYCNTLCTIITGGCYSDPCLAAWGTHCAPFGVRC